MVTGTEVCGPSTVGSCKVMIPRTTFRQTLLDAGSQTRPFFWRRGTHRGKPQRATTNQMGLLLRWTPHQSRDVDPGAVEKARSRMQTSLIQEGTVGIGRQKSKDREEPGQTRMDHGKSMTLSTKTIGRGARSRAGLYTGETHG